MITRISVLLMMIGFLFCSFSCVDAGKANVVKKQSPQYELKWVWEDEFSPESQEKLIAWVSEVFEHAEKVLGQFPFDINIHFYKKQNASEPVPWAHTRRSGAQSVHFHVDPSFKLEEFRNDWTAPHEISHLALPFLGKKNAWFAEGFASYMQYQVMYEMGVLNANELKTKYKEKILGNKDYFKDSEKDFVSTCRDLLKQHNYPAMYWGGASFFYRINEHLLTKESNINSLIKDYQSCCRLNDVEIHEVISSFDSLINDEACSKMMKMYTEEAAKNAFSGFTIE